MVKLSNLFICFEVKSKDRYECLILDQKSKKAAVQDLR